MAEDSSKPPANATATASATSAPAPAAAPAAPLFPPNDPAVTGYYPSARWRNLWNIVTGRMTPDGQEEYREAVYIRDEAIDCARCVEWRDWCFQHSPTVRFLREKTAALNGDLGPDNVVCHRCPAWRDESGRLVRQSGGFSPNHGIKICANELRNRKHLEDTLAHEMVHAWDHLRWKMDWMELRHAACTEIRASNLSGECRWMREFWTRGNWKLTQQHQACVRSRAVQSLIKRPSCKDDVEALKVVNEVWDSCFADTRPFDGIYR